MNGQKHSGLGIASFAGSIIAGLALLVLVVMAGIMEASSPGGMDEESPGSILLGMFLFGFMFLSLVAFCLGVAGLLQSNRMKLFAVLGVVFSFLTLGGVLFLMILGMAMQ